MRSRLLSRAAVLVATIVRAGVGCREETRRESEKPADGGEHSRFVSFVREPRSSGRAKPAWIRPAEARAIEPDGGTLPFPDRLRLRTDGPRTTIEAPKAARAFPIRNAGWELLVVAFDVGSGIAVERFAVYGGGRSPRLFAVLGGSVATPSGTPVRSIAYEPGTRAIVLDPERPMALTIPGAPWLASEPER